MNKEKRNTIVLVFASPFVVVILLGIIAVVQGYQDYLADGRQAKWQAQIDSILSGLDSIPVTVSVTDRWTEKIDSVWLECPVTVSVTGRWTKKIDSDQSDSEEVFVGAYSNTDSNAAQKYLSDWLNATKSFCSRKTNAYTEYKTCMELVTAKATVTRKPGRLSAPPRQYTYNVCYKRHSISYPGESHTDIYLLDASTDVDWRDDSTIATVRTRTSGAQLHYNDRTNRWELLILSPPVRAKMDYSTYKAAALSKYGSQDNVPDDVYNALIKFKIHGQDALDDAEYSLLFNTVRSASVRTAKPALDKGEAQ